MSVNKQVLKRIISHLWRIDNSPERKVVLSYHSINPTHSMGIKPDEFKRQMTWLKKNCKIYSLDEIVDYSDYDRNIISVAITFDDGYEDFYNQAFPILHELNMPVVVFFISGYAGLIPPRECGLFENLRLLSWEQVRELKNYKVSFECHTNRHKNLMSLSQKDIKDELSICKDLIEGATEKEVKYFAFPWGHSNAFSKDMAKYLENLGYEGAFTTMWGKIPRISRYNKYYLPRIDISHKDTFSDFQRKLLGYYDYICSIHNIKYKYNALKRYVVTG